MERKVDAVLLGLVALDAVISVVAFCFPEVWFSVFHGAAYVDPEGLLRRMGANWAAFALIQLVAYRRWHGEPFWLAVVAGARLGDVFTDWACLFFCRDAALLGRAAFIAAGPVNAWLGWFLIRSFRDIQAERPQRG